MVVATLSIIGLTYLSSRSQTADLQTQVDTLSNTVNNLQYSISNLNNLVSSLSNEVSSSSSSGVSSAVLESTCNTVIKQVFLKWPKLANELLKEAEIAAD